MRNKDYFAIIILLVLYLAVGENSALWFAVGMVIGTLLEILIGRKKHDA